MVALRLLKTRVQLQHAPTFSGTGLERVPIWNTYARPWCERAQAYSTQTVAGATTRIQATVYRMRKGPAVAAGHRVIDGSSTFVVAGISDIASGFIEVRVG